MPKNGKKTGKNYTPSLATIDEDIDLSKYGPRRDTFSFASIFGPPPLKQPKQRTFEAPEGPLDTIPEGNEQPRSGCWPFRFRRNR